MFGLRRSTCLIVALLSLSALAGASQAFAQQPLTPLRLRLNWQMKGEFTPLVVAVQQGYFREQGLDVKVEEGSSATQALQALVSGQDDLAYVPSVQLIKAINEGMPVKAIATVVKVDSMAMISKPGIALSSPKDLEGHTVEISAASTFSQIWDAFARKNNIDVGKVKVVSVAPGARFSLLLGGQVDILGDIFMTNEYPVLQAKSEAKLNTLTIDDWGFPLIGYTLVATDSMIKQQPDLLKHFDAGAAKGFAFTIDQPDKAAEIATAAYPQALQLATTKGQVGELVSFLKRGEPKGLFRGGDASWGQTVATLKDSGVISEAKPLGEYYTNDFVAGHE